LVQHILLYLIRSIKKSQMRKKIKHYRYTSRCIADKKIVRRVYNNYEHLHVFCFVLYILMTFYVYIIHCVFVISAATRKLAVSIAILVVYCRWYIILLPLYYHNNNNNSNTHHAAVIVCFP